MHEINIVDQELCISIEIRHEVLYFISQGTFAYCPLGFETRPSRCLTLDLVVYKCEDISLLSLHTVKKDPPKVSSNSEIVNPYGI